MMVDRTPYRPLEEGSQRPPGDKWWAVGRIPERELNLKKNYLVPMKTMVKGLVPYLRGLEARVFIRTANPFLNVTWPASSNGTERLNRRHLVSVPLPVHIPCLRL
jgi:hypothetical protein